MALKPDNQKPTKKDLQMRLTDIAKSGATDFYGMGILLKDTYRDLSDEQILAALKLWIKTNKEPAGRKQSADDKPEQAN